MHAFLSVVLETDEFAQSGLNAKGVQTFSEQP